ncbi:MAG: hypothetical protein M3270_06055 [Thermoproteota archaeon]|nr:hypothetical protein [Thermoproteota archaeon]
MVWGHIIDFFTVLPVVVAGTAKKYSEFSLDRNPTCGKSYTKEVTPNSSNMEDIDSDT